MKLSVGKLYKTLSGQLVRIVDTEGRGRKPFLGKIDQDTKIIKYFRNGSFSNASRVKGGHPLDIVAEIADA
jgi:hypothetical protein